MAILLVPAAARADHVTFSGTFGAIASGSPSTPITASLIGGSFVGSIDPSLIPIVTGVPSYSPDYTLTLTDSSGGVLYSLSGTATETPGMPPVVGVESTTTAGPDLGTALFVDLPRPGGPAGSVLDLILVFDSKSGGDGSTSSLIAAQSGLFDGGGGIVSQLSVAAVTTDLPVSQVSTPSVPEPSSLALCGAGFVGLVAARMRRLARG